MIIFILGDDVRENIDETEDESQAVKNQGTDKRLLRKTINSSSRSNEVMYTEKDLDELLMPKKRIRIVVSNDIKAKAVELASGNPQWTLQQIAQESGLKRIHSRDVLRQWAFELQKGITT